jgi:hypothetical protein
MNKNTNRNDQIVTERNQTTLPFAEISEPGIYHIRATGGLCRVPEEGLKAGHSPVIDILFGGDNRVTKLDANPFTPIAKARVLAANADLDVQF